MAPHLRREVRQVDAQETERFRPEGDPRPCFSFDPQPDRRRGLDGAVVPARYLRGRFTGNPPVLTRSTQ